ncbi:jg26515, partial [Pararge aegeria aegeria]
YRALPISVEARPDHPDPQSGEEHDAAWELSSHHAAVDDLKGLREVASAVHHAPPSATRRTVRFPCRTLNHAPSQQGTAPPRFRQKQARALYCSLPGHGEGVRSRLARRSHLQAVHVDYSPLNSQDCGHLLARQTFSSGG